MKRPVVQARRGIALVITLIMLSVVTITAVAFLAVSRRERGAVSAQGEQIEARNAAEAALNRVKAQIASQIHASGNRSAFGLMVSTNYLNPFSDLSLSYADVTNRDYLTNVSYQGPFTSDSYSKMLANLYYDPRPPVFVATNSDRKLPLDFRFYVDINRNGRFETNGWQQPRDAGDRAVLTAAREFMVGDPEWIGLLERPNLPHSGSNHFGGRFAYLVLPAGRAMDANYLHNSVKNKGTNQIVGSYMRDQGVGSWELNLAGFLTDLNTNAWPVNTYDYKADRSRLNAGLAFNDASTFVLARRQVAFNDREPSTASAFFQSEAGPDGASKVKALFQNQNKTNAVDWYSDGMSTGTPIRTVNELLNPPTGNDDPANFWAGGDYNNSFTDFAQFFSPALGNVGANLAVQTKVNPNLNVNLTYDRYTFQRLLAQLGTEGSDARFESGFYPALVNTSVSSSDPAYNPDGFYRRAKLNLNFHQNDPNGDRQSSASVAPFSDWKALDWFTNASHRLLLTEFPNGLPRRISATEAMPGIAVNGFYYTNNNRFYQTNAYTAQLHRLLQVSANIYDYATNRVRGYNDQPAGFPYLPSVFQPVLYSESNPRYNPPGFNRRVARIARFDQVTTNAELGQLGQLAVLRQPWVDLDDVDFTTTFGAGFNSDPNGVSLAQKNSATDNLLGVNSLKKALYVNIPMVIGAKKGFPNFNEGLWQSGLRVTRRLFVTKPTPTSKLSSTNTLPLPGKSGFKTLAQYRFQLTNHFAVEAWNSYSSNFYASGYPGSVRLIATNVLSFGLFHDGFTNKVGDAVLSVKNAFPLGASPFGSYLVRGTNFDLGTTPANRWQPERFIRALNDQLQFDFTYNPDTKTITLRSGASSTNLIEETDLVNVDATRPPMLHLAVTNRMMFALVDIKTGALLDYVNLKSVIAETNLMRFFGAGRVTPIVPGAELTQNGNSVSMPSIWNTNALAGGAAVGATVGIYNQLLASLGRIDVGNLWKDALGGAGLDLQNRIKTINGLYYFLYGDFPNSGQLKLSESDQATIRKTHGTNTFVQVGFNPSPTLFLTDRLQANDPLVHYTREDLAPGYTLFCDSADYGEIPGPNGPLTTLTGGFQLTLDTVRDRVFFDLNDKLGNKGVLAYAPWGRGPQLQTVATLDSGYNLYLKDPQITRSDDWAFPTNAQTKFPGIGFLGRVHRGTPWQTVYLKSQPVATTNNSGDRVISLQERGFPSDRIANRPTWAAWSGSSMTSPTNDWKFLDLFTTAINDNAARGLMSVNQTNIASWSALLSGVSLLDTSGTVVNSSSATKPQAFELAPGSDVLRKILVGYTNTSGVFKTVVPGLMQVMTGTNNGQFPKIPVTPVVVGNVFYPGGTFANLGSILSVPTLSDRAPFLFDHVQANWPKDRLMTDEVIERLPQQILSLLRADEPRVVVYSYGQSLKPALNSLITKPGTFYGLCTNYQITGEYVTKTTLRFDGSPGNLRTVVEDHRVLYPGN